MMGIPLLELDTPAIARLQLAVGVDRWPKAVRWSGTGEWFSWTKPNAFCT
jgi:hypothetical protein